MTFNNLYCESLEYCKKCAKKLKTKQFLSSIFFRFNWKATKNDIFVFFIVIIIFFGDTKRLQKLLEETTVASLLNFQYFVC
jgi:hypothetical protein